ncbi:hypothetical protein SEUCBS139899_010504 [Sporothrix eucalyptigena]|uniref:Uncharacterized protein n=1 Tax=Sporothrix eucalyptigena TaxID=1812306 RepID=A0ABP0ART1_9PEZI
MSYFGDDGNDTVDNPLFTHKTWVGIVVPFCVVAGILLAAAVFFYRRRRLRQRRNGVSLNRQGRLALERDILQEEGGYGDDRPRQFPIDQHQGIYLGRYFRSSNSHAADLVVNGRAPRRSSSGVTGTGGRRQPRTANRWAWANTTDLSATTRGQDRMEGLNELGEAPPPYEPPPKKHNSTSGSNDEAVHLDDDHGEDGVSSPERAYLRRASGSGTAHERNRSLDGDTIAATLTAATISTMATTAATTTTTTTSAATSSRSRPVSSTSTEQAEASTSSTVVTSPPASPPAYSERTTASERP